MAFSPFSQIVQSAPWVDPINLDLLRQGNMYKEEIARQNLLNLSESFQALASTPAYGKDAEKLQEKMQELKSQISGLNLSDVSDYNTMGQIKGVINQFSNDKDILGIGQRGTKYNEWEKQIKDYQEKGKFVPAWKLKAYNDAQNYYNGKDFISDKRFSGTITPGFDWDKHNKTLVEETPEYHQLKKVGGNNDLYQGKTYESLLGKFYEGLKQPGAYDDLNAQFEHFYGNEDYAKQDQQTALQQVNRLQGIIQNSNNPILIEKAKRDLDYWDDFANTVNPNTSKEDAFERFIKSNAEDFARTNTNYALKESKMSDATKLEKDFIYDKALIQEREKSAINKLREKEILKAQLGTANINPVRKARLIAASNLDYDISDPNSPDKYVSDEVLDSYGLSKQAAKEAAKADDTKILLGEKEYTKRNAIEGVLSGNTAITKLLIESYGDKLPGGLEAEDTDIKIDGDNILYEQSGGTGNVFGYDKSINKYKFIGNVFGYVDEEGNDVEGIENLTDEQIKEMYNSGIIIIK